MRHPIMAIFSMKYCHGHHQSFVLSSACLLWCPVVVSCCNVLLWCPAVMSCCGVLLWCPVVMSCCCVLLWCPAVVSCCGVLLWCPVVEYCCGYVITDPTRLHYLTPLYSTNKQKLPFLPPIFNFFLYLLLTTLFLHFTGVRTFISCLKHSDNVHDLVSVTP